MVEYIVEGYNIDLGEDAEIEISYSINDIRNPVSTNNFYSKTVKLPGTDNNNTVFKYIYDNNVVNSYNPNLKRSCELRVDGVTILVGYQQLKEISVVNGIINYDIIIMGDNTSIFTEMGDDLLTDLDFSEYDHVYGLSAIENSWTGTSDTQLYYYPYMIYQDWHWNAQDFIDNSDDYPFYPACYVKTIIDKIFDTYGYTYTYTSDFFNTDLFKNLIIPFTNDYSLTPIEDIVIENGSYARHQYPDGSLAHSATTTSYVDNYSIFTPVKHVCGIGPGQDDVFCDYYDGGTLKRADWWMGKILTPGNGTWTLHMSGRTMVEGDPVYRYADYRCDHLIITIYTKNLYNSGKTEMYRQRWENPSNDPYDGFDFEFTYEFPEIYGNRELYIKPYVYGYPDGDELFGNSGGILYTAEWTYKSTSLIKEQSVIQSHAVLPSGLKQSDFFKTIINMFNLYFERNSLDNKNITIEPYNLYYDKSTNNVDWTYKVDWGNRKYKLMSELNSNSYLMTYKSDTDYLNTLYKKTNDKLLGELTVYNQTDFQKNQTKVELACSPTCIEKVEYGGYYVIIPSMYVDVTDTDISDNYGISGFTGDITTKWNWRILSKNRINMNWIYYFNSNGHQVWNTASHINGWNGSYNSGNTSLLFDNVISTGLTWDYPYTGITTLYENYWTDYFDIIRHPNSKLLVIDVFLTEVEISNLRFYQKIFLDDSWYYLNRLVYNPITRRSQAELLLIPASEYTAYYFSNFEIDGDDIWQGDDLTCRVSITNLTNQEQQYDGYFSMVDVGGNTTQLVAFHGTVPRNTTIIVTEVLPCPVHGNYLIHCKDTNGDFDQVLSLHIQIPPYRYESLELYPSVGVYVGDSIVFSMIITAQDPEFTGCTSGTVVLNSGETHSWSWCSSGESSTAIGIEFNTLVHGDNAFVLWVDGQVLPQDNIHIIADTHPVVTWSFVPEISGNIITTNETIQRPTIGNYNHIQWYFDWENTNQHNGSVYFTVVADNPDIGTETFTSTVGNITGVHYLATIGNLTHGTWTFDPTDPNDSEEQGTLVVNYTLGNNGYQSVTGQGVIIDMYNDYEKTSKAYSSVVFSNQTIPIGGKVFTVTYTNLPNGSGTSMSNPASMYLEATVVGKWYDNPVGYYPFYVQPCPWNVSGDMYSITPNVSGGTTTLTTQVEVWNYSCHRLDAADYTIRYTYYSDSGSTIVGYDYPTTVDIDPNDYEILTEYYNPPNTWTTGIKKVLVEINIMGEGYTSFAEDTYNYYQLANTADKLVITAHSITQSTYHLQVNIDVQNQNSGTCVVSGTHLWYNPMGTQIRGTQTSSSSILSGRTETLSNSIDLDEYVNGEYTCVSTIKYSSTGITGSPVTDTITSCFYTLGNAVYTDVNVFGDESECGGSLYPYSIHRATINLKTSGGATLINSGGTLTFNLTTSGTSCSVTNGRLADMSITIPHGASSGYTQYTALETIDCSGTCKQVIRYPDHYLNTGSSGCGWTITGLTLYT